MRDFWEKAEILIEVGVATEEEISLVSQINGQNEQTLEDILYVRTGYRDLQDFIEDNDFWTIWKVVLLSKCTEMKIWETFGKRQTS